MPWILSLISSAFGVIGQGISGFFGVKQAQADTVNKVIEVIGASEASAATREQAISAIISAEANSESWLTRSWRPITMTVFVGFIIAYFMGYTTPNLLIAMPETSALSEIFAIVKIGLCGYIPARSFEKIVDSITRAGITKQVIEVIGNKIKKSL